MGAGFLQSSMLAAIVILAVGCAARAPAAAPGAAIAQPATTQRYAPITEASGMIRPHPFLFFTLDDVPRLRSAARTTHRAQFEHLLAWGRLFADFDPIPANKLPANIDVVQVYYENGAAYIFNMALLYHLTGDDTWARAAERWLAAFCTYPTDTGGGYFIGSYALALAYGYDLLYPRLDEAARTLTRDHLAALLERGQRDTGTAWWAGLRLHHDHWLPAAGLCVGALALVDGTPAADARVQFFADHFEQAHHAVGGDGSWTEGVAQSVYAMNMVAIYYDARKHVTGENHFRQGLMANSIDYRLYQWLSDDHYIYHHDSFGNGRYNVSGSVSSPLLRKLAAETRSGQAQWLADKDEPVDLHPVNNGAGIKPDWETGRNSIVPALHAVGWSFLWYDPTVQPVPPDSLPNHRFFPNQGLVVLRSGWQKENVVFTFTCAPVGGHLGRDAVLAGDHRVAANIGHIHALAGSFNLWANGNYLAAPAGYGMRESCHENTLTIEGCDQFLDPRYDATIRHLAFGDDYAYIAGEATGCYPSETGLTRWIRHVAWLEPDVFIIADELSVAAPSARGRDTVWRLDYIPEVNQASIKQPGQALISSRQSDQDGALAVQLLTPAKLRLENAEVVHPSGWLAYAQVRACQRDLFKDSTQAAFVAVLAALKNRSATPPPARLIKAEHLLGAVMDQGGHSRAAAFLTGDPEAAAKAPLQFAVSGMNRLTCMLFGLSPNSSWDAVQSAQPADGRVSYTVTLQPGRLLRVSPDGVLILQLVSK